MVKLWSGIVLALVLQAVAQAEPLDFSLPDAQGQQRSLSEFRGKWVVINYWATWCPPCLEEIPDLVLFHERHHKQDAMVLGINYESLPIGQIRAFIDRYEMTYPVLLNTEATAPHARLAVDALPMTYIVSPEGELVARHAGSITADDLEAFIEKKNRERAAGRQTSAAPLQVQP